MGKAICKMFLTMELSVKSFINSSLARHCAIGACMSIPHGRDRDLDLLERTRKCYAAPMTVPAHSDPPASKFADSDLLSRTLSGQLAASLEAAIAARGLASLVVSGGKSPSQLLQSLSGEDLGWSRLCLALRD